MSTTDVTFIQTVIINGYRWKDTIHPQTGNAIPALYESPQRHLPGPEASLEEHLHAIDEAWKNADAIFSRHYSTVDVPNLYRIFASTQTTKDAVLAFANKYGFIGVGESIVFAEDVNPYGSLGRVCEIVEFGHIWAREIASMRTAVELLDLMDEALGTNIDELSKRFIWTNGAWHVGREYLPNYTDQGKVDLVDLDIWADDPKVFTSLASDDITGVAIEFLRTVANQHLAGRVNAVIVWDDEHTKTMLIYKPTSLLGAMWMQFVATFTRTNNSRACIECGKIFDFVRRNRVFCSEACQKRYGRRKARQAAKQ
ncbi:MAG: FYVE zinc finger domain-containing protein [Armatimonadota bacterium]